MQQLTHQQLCARLHELKPYWGNTVAIYYRTGQDKPWQISYDPYLTNTYEEIPYYDLEWALNKLPSNYCIMWHDFPDIDTGEGIIKQGRAYAPMQWHGDTEIWESFFESGLQSDDPTCAALQLLINLIEEKVI